jgi:hypothetical protein
MILDNTGRNKKRRGTWNADNTFALSLCFFETPFSATFTFHFAGEELQLDIKDNVSFGPTERPRLVGQAVEARKSARAKA